MRIAIENSTWNNIGDAFYQSSLVASFEEIAPEAEIVEFDGPIERSFRANPGDRSIRRFYDSRFGVDADLFVFSGPLLNKAFLAHYGDLIRHIVAKGGRFMILSTFAKEDGSEQAIKQFLAEHRPLAISSRDDPTFNRFSQVSEAAFRGICSAFYIPYVRNLAPMAPERPYIISSFYTRPEAHFRYLGAPSRAPDWSKLEVNAPLWPKWSISRHFQRMKQVKSEVAGHDIVRAVHDIAYKFNHLNFPVAGRYLSYNPKCFISLYANASLVVSDRVHACVAGLAFGKPARLIGKFDRAALLEAHGVVTPDENGLLHSDTSKIAALRQQFHMFLRNVLDRETT